MGKLFAEREKPITGKGKRYVKANPDNVLGGFTKDTAPEGVKISSGGFIDDGARRMPSATDAVARENEAMLRRRLTSRSGRTATDLSGTRTYTNNFLGGV